MIMVEERPLRLRHASVPGDVLVHILMESVSRGESQSNPFAGKEGFPSLLGSVTVTGEGSWKGVVLPFPICRSALVQWRRH